MGRSLTMVRAAKRFMQEALPNRLWHPIYRRLAIRYVEQLAGPYDPDKPTILAIDHFFDQDLRALEQANRDFNIVRLSATQVNRGLRFFFSADTLQLLQPYDREPLEHRMSWRRVCDDLFHVLEDRFHPRLVLTPSDIYPFVREMITVARERGIPTVMLDKEGSVTPSCHAAYSEKIREFVPPMCDHIFVWSERQRQYWSMAGAPEEQITVVGQPRTDLLHSENRDEVQSFFARRQPLITLFSYMTDVHIFPELFPETAHLKGNAWQVMKTETHDFLASMAEAYPHYNFVFKAHPQQPDLRELRQKYDRDNLRVLGGASVAAELIKRSELIIGFQTTALIEAMFMGRRIVYTCWDPHYTELIPHCLPIHEARGIVVARTAAVFGDTVRRFLEGDTSAFDFSSDDLAARDSFVDQYFYRPDGRVSQRFFDEIGKMLK